MKINILFPTVMKMELRAVLEFDDSAKMSEIQEKIFKVFWQTMAPHSSIGEHGKPSAVILRDEQHQEITSEISLKEYLAKSTNFEVVFTKHVPIPIKKP